MTALKISSANKMAYGIGSVAFGIFGVGFDFFLLLFYSQVMGVDAYLVGAVVTPTCTLRLFLSRYHTFLSGTPLLASQVTTFSPTS